MPETSSIYSGVSVEHRLATERHRAIASRAAQYGLHTAHTVHCFDLLLICFLYGESKKWRLSHSRCAVNTESEPETDQCLNGRAPPYLSEHYIPVSSADTRRHLRSANRHLLAVPRFRLNAYGRRAFHVAGPMAWNSLPDFFPGSNEQHRLF